MKHLYSSRTQRIGILGGTFDPIHIGHLVMAQAALEGMRLKEIIFVPSHLPPHKNSKDVTPAHDRLQMVTRAIKDNPSFKVSDFEVKKEGRSYSIDTVQHFKGLYHSQTKLFFIVGQDAFGGLGQWKDINGILKLVDFVVVNRPGCKERQGGIKHHSVLMPGIDISSSEVRQQAAQGNLISYLVPKSVAEYIEKRGLYQNKLEQRKGKVRQ